MIIPSAQQIRALDNFTIENEPVSSIDLMERASMVFTNWYTQNFDYKESRIAIFCGPGNNGGDGLAVARMLHHSYYEVHLYLCKIGEKTSVDFDENLKRLPKHSAIEITTLEKGDPFPKIDKKTFIIDAIFGSGLNRPIIGYWGELINYLNQLESTRISIDIPSGLFADRHSNGVIFEAEHTFSFEFPKLAFMFSENYKYIGEWTSESIELSKKGMDQIECNSYYLEESIVNNLYRKKGKFDHKGTNGHALLIAGSYGMIGAANLAASAALHSGAGKVTLHSPKTAYSIIQTALPEVILSIDPHEHYISELPNPDLYNSIGIGPGISTNKLTTNSLVNFIKSFTSPIILDADALNIISSQSLLEDIPINSILTPHLGEFKRLFGTSDNDFEQNLLQRTKAKEFQIYIILKGPHTCIACPNGDCYFNSTGNQGMATAGSGDVLTGIITSLLAQGYPPKSAALLGVYLHGLAGDKAFEKTESFETITASEIIAHLGQSFATLY